MRIVDDIEFFLYFCISIPKGLRPFLCVTKNYVE